jgi:2,3-bisphosphoglycerate-independent phosphoglycerate mutase
VAETVLKNDGVMLLTADHGNCETMIDEHGGPHTAHTTNLVPLILVSSRPELQLDKSRQYSLSDIATTILDIMGIPKPSEMTSPSILKIEQPAALQ